MPSLEDIPNLVSKPTPSGSDLIPLHDVTEVGNSRAKKATLLQAMTAVVAALPGPFSDDTTAAAQGVPLGALYLSDAAGSLLIGIRTV